MSMLLQSFLNKYCELLLGHKEEGVTSPQTNVTTSECPDEEEHAVDSGAVDVAEELMVFVNTDNESRRVVAEMLDRVDAHKLKAHIYIMGMPDGESVQRWAESAHIPQVWVKQGRITLSLDNGCAKRILAERVGQPAIVRYLNGHFVSMEASMAACG